MCAELRLRSFVHLNARVRRHIHVVDEARNRVELILCLLWDASRVYHVVWPRQHVLLILLVRNILLRICLRSVDSVHFIRRVRLIPGLSGPLRQPGVVCVIVHLFSLMLAYPMTPLLLNRGLVVRGYLRATSAVDVTVARSR